MQGRLQAGLANAFHQFQKLTLVPKIVCALFPLFYLLGYIPKAEENLVITPGFLAPPLAKLWTIVTAVFYENNILWVFLDVIALVGFSLLLEPLWGLKRYLIFSGLVGGVSNISVAVICMLLYAVTGSVHILFAKLHGFIGLVCGYLVAVKQVHPDSVAFPPPAPPTLRVKHLPILVTFTAFLFAVFKLVSFTHSLLAFNGMVVAWTYLRFYEKQDSGTRGDMSEAFSFATFFPEIMHPSVSSLGEVVYRLLVKVKICRTVKTYDVGGPSTIKIALPPTTSSTSVDTERRKQRALKALDERLSKAGQSQQINWPALDDNTSSSSSDEQPPPSTATVSASTPASAASSQSTAGATVPNVIVKTVKKSDAEEKQSSNDD